MKIHILTGHFTPQIHPRAFRANELALEFKRLGYDVTVSNLTKILGYDYDSYTRQTGVKIENLSLYQHSMDESLISKRVSFFSKIKDFVSEYFFAGRLFQNSIKIADRLVIDKDTDLIISLSTPFMDVLGMSKYLKRMKERSSVVAIADSGDPFFYSKQYSKAPWFYWVEKKAYEQYDYLTIPVETAIPSYNKLLPESKIKIIPQAFNLNDIKLYEGELGKKVQFAYAGVFYWDIRNPEFLFKFLDNLELDYEFNVFMRYADSKLNEVLSNYPNLQKHIKISLSVPRKELLYELSKMHFLININNISNTQIPSKIIDYRISNRPILSFNSSDFNEDVFLNFLNGNYQGQMEVDITKYDIRNVAQQFLSLYNAAIINRK